MKLIILGDYNEASEWAAKYIRNKILLFNPGPDHYFTLGLPTGKQELVRKKPRRLLRSQCLQKIPSGDISSFGLPVQ